MSSHPTSLSQLGRTYGGLTGKSKHDFGDGGAHYVTFMDVISHVRVLGDSLERVRTSSSERQNEVRRGDLLFNGSSETPEEVALSAVVHCDLPRPTFLNSFCFGFRLTNPDHVLAEYLAYFFRGPEGRALVAPLAQGATRYNISKKRFAEVELELPDGKVVKRTVEALGACDQLIAAVERLITKKQAIKQGMAQALVTGLARLPGFRGPWTAASLDELLSYEQPGPYLIHSDIRSRGSVPVLTAGKTFVLGFTDEIAGVYTNHPVIIFDDFTTASKYVDFDFKAKSSAMKILHARPGADLRFMYERLQLIRFPILDHKRRWISEYRKLSVDAPSYEEQRAIGGLLTSADKEIEVLSRRLAKLRDVKQGMMQELLTGRTRLVPQGVSA